MCISNFVINVYTFGYSAFSQRCVRLSVLRPGVNVMNINNRDLGLERDILIQTEKEDKPVK